MGTIATINAANPESIYCCEIVTPPLPPSSKHAPMMNDVRQFAQVAEPASAWQPLRLVSLLSSGCTRGGWAIQSVLRTGCPPGAKRIDLPMPCDRAIAYMIMPANTNRAPAIRNGGIVSIENLIPR